MITETVNLYSFRDAFKSVRPDNFSHEGLEALYDWLEELSDSTGEPVEMDVIALCATFGEYTLDELNAEYAELYGEDGADWESVEDAAKTLSDYTTVIPVGCHSIIILGF